MPVTVMAPVTEATHNATSEAVAAVFHWDIGHPGSRRSRHVMSARLLLCVQTTRARHS